MMLSNDGVKFIRGFESYMKKLPDGRCQAYRCIVGRDKKGRPIHDGKWSIGWGCTGGVTEGMIWTREQAEEAFRKELVKHEIAVASLVKVPITQHQADALISFSYNCGSHALETSTLLKKLNKGDTAGAAREFGHWTGSNGVKNVPGLVRRRAEEAVTFLRPDQEVFAEPGKNPVPEMPQSVDAPAPVMEAARKSWTIFGALSTLFSFLAYVFNESVSIALDAVSQIDVLAPIGRLFSGLGASVVTTTLALTIASILWVIFRRGQDAATGKNVR